MEDKVTLIKVSIITPCYNSEKLLASTISSVLAQTHRNWELILINDCSTDETLRVINDYVNTDERIKVIDFEKNQGIAAARNAGIEIAIGKYICFLDSDDLWDNRKLQVQLQFMVRNEVSISHTAYRKIHVNGNVVSKYVPVSESVGYNQLLKHNEMGCLTVMYDSEKLGKLYFIKVGHEDFAYWLDILKKGNRSFGINEVLASYRVHSNTTSSNKLKAASFTWNILRNVEKLSLIRSAYYFVHYSARSSIKFFN